MDFPAVSARAMLEGLGACGVSRDRVVANAQLDAAKLERRDGALEAPDFGRLWAAAFELAPRATLPLEVGLAVPYGAFGALDYLAGSSETVAASLDSLAAYFRFVTPSIALEIDAGATHARVRVQNAAASPNAAASDAFCLGVLLARYRALSAEPLRATLELAAPAPADPARFAAVARTEVTFGARVSAMVLARGAYDARLRSADPRLHETLRTLAGTLSLGDKAGELERAVRARLRNSLPEGRADAASVARTLGMGERTMQRRLEASGRTFQSIVDDFRHDEALALLHDARLDLAEVARRLGFAEQSSFTRAFKRWTGETPRARRRGAART